MGGLMSKKYSEKLKNPKWQKKRLEIMERDGWSCQICDNKSKTLNVHHLFYEYGKDPWDYNNHQLVTLCEECHKREHDSKAEVDMVIKAIIKRGFSYLDVINFFWLFKAMFINKDMFEAGLSAFASQMESIEDYLETTIKKKRK